VALLANRAIALAAPFRVRPMYTSGIGYRPPSIAVNYNLEGWSAFPSDMATYFVALAFGFVYLARRLGIALLVYVALVILTPRLYLGIHYASDMMAGAVLGIAGVVVTRNRATDRWIATPLLAFAEAHPGPFHALMFALAFEMADIFMHIRHAGHSLATMLAH